MARFTLPRDLYHGKGALEALKSFTGKKAMICVGGGSMKRFGFLDRAVAYLKEAGMEVQLFEGIESDPSVETVMRGAKAMEEFQPEQGFDGVLSRAFASLTDMLNWCHHLPAPHGAFLALKGLYPEDELAALPKGFVMVSSHPLHVPELDGERHLIVLKKQ